MLFLVMAVIFRDIFFARKCGKMSLGHRERTSFGKNALWMLLLLVCQWWTYIAAEPSSHVKNPQKHHHRYPERVIHHQFNHSPTAAAYSKIRSTHPASSSSSSYRYLPSPTRAFYKMPATMEVRRNGSVNDAPMMMRKPPPDTNPWFTLYRPTASPQYPHRTKKPVEPSWKPAQVVLDEVPRDPSPRFRETNLKQHAPNEYYNHLYGTHEGVKHLKGNYGPSNLSEAKARVGITQDLEDVRLANEHFLKMRSGGRCKVPAPEVVCVKDLYPNPTKEYLPRCTLLHRCGDRSGCCDSDALSCMPRAMQEVALNFYIVHVGLPASEVGLENSVEKLFFANHTECECLPNPVSVVAPSDQPVPTKPTVENDDDPPLQDNHKELRANEIHHDEEKDPEEQIKQKCRECPLPFHLRQHPDGRCSCDCFDKQKPCLRIKRGREALPEHEKRCVESTKCNIPNCEYGLYITTTGRCPKKPEDFQKPGKNNDQRPRSLHNPIDRWIYFERD